jgi:stearoyl-CoA desaturase (delta-9 desaturase)
VLFNGILDLPWWGYVVVALTLTHITIASVTIFLHRHQAHRALDLHPVVSHFFRFWLWLTTGMITREWAAVHRKHHARVETPEDPHSPQHYGINRVLWRGVGLYRQEIAKRETIEKYGHGAPNDWIERHLYSAHNSLGLAVLAVLDLVLFGLVPGVLIWLVQLAWIPFWAAGVINGIGHYWGYRNFEVADASTNIVPWGILIGGEELHNNHHTHASSAKLSAKWWEIDIGWVYIRTLALLGLARVKKVPPALSFDPRKTHIDLDTVRAVVASRFQLMAQFAREVLKPVHREVLARLDRSDRETRALLKRARRLMVRNPRLLSPSHSERLQRALAHARNLQTVYVMKQKLQEVWLRSATTQEHLVKALQDWCHEAEQTRIHALQAFAAKIRSCSLGPAATGA